MHVELPTSKPLETLDIFLRETWVECCEHLSAFTIDGTSYNSEADEYYFAMTGATAVIEEVSENDEATDQYTVDLAGWLKEGPEVFRMGVPSALLKELKKVWDRDELVAFLKARLKALPKSSSFPSTEEGYQMYFSNDRQRSLMEHILREVEDTSMSIRLGIVLTVGQTFTHAYDFGSTTYLTLKVMAERVGAVADKDDPVEILARNNPPTFLCVVCGKPATKIGGYDFDAYCDEHARKAGNAEMMLPIVNSPRVGVCGYTGDAEFEDGEWEDEE